MYDYAITAVRYDSTETHIEAVRVHKDRGSSIGDAMVCDRAFVADLITNNKATFQTVVRGTSSAWQNGAHIHVIDDVYLSTDPNGRKKDNLGNLPTF